MLQNLINSLIKMCKCFWNVITCVRVVYHVEFEFIPFIEKFENKFSLINRNRWYPGS